MNKPETQSGGSLEPVGSVSRWWKRYRIVKDGYLGYEVQCWRVWLPVWMQCGFPGANTHRTVEAAEHYARNGKSNGVVKYL